jgi:ketosteroid isomerase-like protein
MPRAYSPCTTRESRWTALDCQSRARRACRTLCGHDGLRKFTRDWNEAWEYAEDHCEELIDAGGEHVISVVTRRGRGLASGVEVETRRGGVWTIRDGKVVRTVWFPSVEEALEALGLSEQDAHVDS